MIVFYSLILLAITIASLKQTNKWPLWQIIGLGLLTRIIMIFLSSGYSNNDIESFITAGRMILNGEKIYPDYAVVYNAFFPLITYIEMASHSFGSWLLPSTAFKLIIACLDILNIYLVYKLTKQNRSLTLAYSLNPIVVLAIGFQGQFDSLAVMFLLLALYLLAQNKQALSVLSYGLAILAKTWPVLFIIPYLRKIKPKYLLLLIPLVLFMNVLVYQLLFQESMLAVFETVKNYRGQFGFWGISRLYRFLLYYLVQQNPNPINTRFLRIIFFGVLFVFSLIVKKQKPLKAIYLLILFFYSFTFALAVQYLAWIVPFLLIIKKQKAWFLYTGMLCYQLLVYSSWIYPAGIFTTNSWEKIITVTGLILWLYIIGFWWQETKQIVKA